MRRSSRRASVLQTAPVSASRSRSTSASRATQIQSRTSPGIKASPSTEFRARTSLLDGGTMQCDLTICGELDDDAWRTVSGPSVPFSNQPFSRQIQGWLHLFWFLVAYYVAASWYEHYKATGSWYGPTSWKLLHLTYRDWWGLFGFDLLQIGFTFISVPIQWAIFKGILPARGSASWILRHFLALSPIFIAVRICHTKLHWPSMQVGTFLMHSIVLFMKMHSYFAINAELHDIWCQKGMKKTRMIDSYPQNISFGNFLDFLLVPTLIYQPSYPRTPRIRWSFVFDRVLGSLVIVSMIYINMEMYLLPVFRKSDSIPFLDCLTQTLLPLALNSLLLFFLVFEYILNFFAEITRFADRHFYSDWWNSLDYSEFARKWNVPIHKFLQQHLYLACMTKHGWSRKAAAFWTFLFSSILHELIMSMSVRRARYEFFVCQMFQIPFIWISTKLHVSRYPKMANILFWVSLFVGMTGLLLIYSRSDSFVHMIGLYH